MPHRASPRAGGIAARSGRRARLATDHLPTWQEIKTLQQTFVAWQRQRGLTLQKSRP